MRYPAEPEPQPPADGTVPAVAALRAEIAGRIARAGGRIPFAEYMDLALYHPAYGYYSAGTVALGRGGDFVTSAEEGPGFGELLAVLVARADTALDHPPAFLLAEHGAGSGRLLAALLTAVQAADSDLYARLRPVIVERSPALRARQQARFATSPHAGRVAWADQAAGTGLIYSNELLDAFPVHRVVMGPASLQEIYVAQGTDGGFVEERGPLSDPALAAYFDRLGLAPPPGQVCEVNLAAAAWPARAVAGLDRGFLLTIDYGDSAVRLYSPLRPEGTLLCYSNGQVSADVFAAPGAQDMTAHVDFTTLEQAGHAAGLATVAATRQLDLLVALGIGERIAALSAAPTPARGRATLAQRAALFRLIDPDGLGRFHVLLQARGVPAARAAALLPVPG